MTLQRLSEIAGSRRDRAARARALATAIREARGYRWVGIYDVERAAGQVVILAWDGPSAPAFPTFPIGSGLTWRAIATAATVNAGDVTEDAAYLDALSGTRSEIIVPVLWAGEVVGTIDVESPLKDAFDAAEQRFLESCAAAIAPLWT